MSVTISIPFVLTGDQQYCKISYRPLGSTGAFSVVTPYPTVSPYELELPDGLYEISAQPSCPESYGPSQSIVAITAANSCKPPTINGIIEEPGIDGNPPKRVVKVILGISFGLKIYQWYINGVFVRDSLLLVQTFEIPDPLWNLESVTIGVRTKCSETSFSNIVSQVKNLTRPNPSSIICPVPGITMSGVTDTTAVITFNLPSVASGITITNVKYGYRVWTSDNSNAYTYVDLTVSELPKTITGLTPEVRYEFVGLIECTDGVDPVWSGQTSPVTVIMEAAGANPEPEALQPPPFLLIQAVSDTHVEAIWDLVSGADNYEIEIWLISPEGVDSLHAAGSTGAYVINGLIADTNYKARIRSLKTTPSEVSAWSDFVEFTTTATGDGGGGGEV